MKLKSSKGFLELNISVLLISGSGLFAELIDAPATEIISGRLVFAALSLFLVMLFAKISFKISTPKDWFWMLSSGVLVTIHWITYFLAVQKSTLAIGIISLYTFPVITAVLEPLFTKQKIERKDIGLTILILVGVMVMAIDFEGDNTNSFEGILWGVLSALCYALRNLIVKLKLHSFSGITVMWYQVTLGAILMLPVFYLAVPNFETSDWGSLLALGVVFTALAHTLFVLSLKKMSAKTASVLASVLPVYTVVWGVVFLQQYPKWQVLFGGFVILSAVLIEVRSLKNKRKNKV